MSTVNALCQQLMIQVMLMVYVNRVQQNMPLKLVTLIFETQDGAIVDLDLRYRVTAKHDPLSTFSSQHHIQLMFYESQSMYILFKDIKMN